MQSSDRAMGLYLGWGIFLGPISLVVLYGWFPPTSWWYVLPIIGALFFLPHSIAILILWVIHPGLAGIVWILLMAIGIFTLINIGIDNVLDDLSARFPRQDQQLQQQPRDVHHYHHVTTDDDLSARVEHVERLSDPHDRRDTR